MSGYTRQDVANNIANGKVIDADYLDQEFDALASSFVATTGHTHDGSVGEGAPITVTGPTQDFVASGTSLAPKADSTYTLGTDTERWSKTYTDEIEIGNGLLSWNTDEKTLDLTLNATGVTLQIGQESFIRVQNDTGATLTNGTVVQYAGAIGASGFFRASKMVSTSSGSARLLLGVVTEDILNGEVGFVTAVGRVRGLDTSAYTAGQVLWCDPSAPGGLTATEPEAPNLKLPVAVVVNSHATQGTLFVRTLGLGTSIADDALVQLSGLANNDLLVYNGATGRFENKRVLDGLTSVSSTTGAFSDMYATRGIFEDGTNTLPSITNNGDTDTGIYFPSDDQIGFSVGGNLKLTVASTGLLGATLVTPTISGGTISGITDLAIADGGTGASTAATARANLGITPTNIGAQPLDATLTSIAALGTAADKLAYTTGVDTWAESAITAFGRSLIDDADSTAAHGTLDTLAFLGNQLPTRTTDLGASADLNTITTPGFYQQPLSSAAASGSNYPVAQAGALAVYESGAKLGGVGAGVVQVYTQYWRAADGQARTFFRSEYNNTWSPWHEIAAAPVGTSFACRAWVNFNGTGTPSIRASGNVSSITDLGTGKWRVNFSTAMPDASYSVAVIAHRSGADYTHGSVLGTGTKTASAVDVTAFTPGGTVAPIDAETINVAIFR
mgnify:CR=1 FL=1